MGVGTPVDEFELMRRRVKQDSQVAGQQRQRDLKRQFARTGNLQSGAFIKQSGIESQQAQQAQQRAVEGVDIAEAGVRREERQAQIGRDFAAGEALKSRDFASKEAESQRTFAAMQAQLGREFTTQERGAAQAFASTEAETQRRFQDKLAKEGRDFNGELASNAEALQREIMDFEQVETRKVNALNAMNSLLNIGFQRDEVENILDQLGLSLDNFDLPGTLPGNNLGNVNPEFDQKAYNKRLAQKQNEKDSFDP